MARLPHLVEVARKFDLKLVSIEDLVAYRMRHDSLITKKEAFELKTRFGLFTLHAYQQTTNDQVHLALTKRVLEVWRSRAYQNQFYLGEQRYFRDTHQ